MAARKFLGDIIARYLGIGGAEADSTNVLSVRGPGSLYDGNTGGHQIRLNKAAAGDTVSFLFQTGFSGRAEFGTIGNDDFELKVSPDGSAFTQAFVVDKDTGVTDFKEAPTYDGQALYHTGDFDISAYAALTGATFTGGITATTFAGNGADLTDVDADYLGGQSPSAYALLAGASFTGAVSAAGGLTAGANQGLTHQYTGVTFHPARVDLPPGISHAAATPTDGFPAFGGLFTVNHSANRCFQWFLDGQSGRFWLRVNHSYQPDVQNDWSDLYEVWGEQRQGAGTGMDADLLDGYEAAEFALLSGADFTGTVKANRLGVGGATPDATNTFAFYGTNMLFNSGGSIVANFNKNAEANDASFAFQSGFTSYAQMGLLGDHNWTLKVGGSATTAIVADESTGAVELTQHPKFSGYVNYDQYNAADTWFAVAVNNMDHNDQGAVASGVFTAPHDGYYCFSGSIVHKTNGTVPTRIALGFSIDGAAPTATNQVWGASGTIDDQTGLQITRTMKLSAGDEVTLRAFFQDQDAYVLADYNNFSGHQVP